MSLLSHHIVLGYPHGKERRKPWKRSIKWLSAPTRLHTPPLATRSSRLLADATVALGGWTKISQELFCAFDGTSKDNRETSS
jgi:hypothetical protein